jgi:carboxyl-terminal processing protease
MKHFTPAGRLFALSAGLGLVIAPFLAASSTPAQEETTFSPTKKQSRTSERIIDRLQAYHYRDLLIDDSLSSDLLDRYIEFLDPWHSYFLASDLRGFEHFRSTLDDSLRDGDVRPAFEIFQSFHKRTIARIEWIQRALDEGFDELTFDVDEWLEYDREHAPFPADLKEADELWRLRLKDEILGLRLSDRKTMDEIRDLLVDRYANQLLRAKQVHGGDVFAIYMRAFTRGWDPHTDYFPPRDAENFQIEMSLSLEGIGALLGIDGLYTVIRSLVPGGPAEKSEELAATDRIVSVTQGNEDPVDIVGWRLDEVVDLVRGSKGSTVHLEILGADQNDISKSRMVTLIRDEIKLEDQAAQSTVIEVERDEQTYKVGVIEVDSFYMDFEAFHRGDPEYRSSTRDVAKLIEELRKDSVNGIVLDLRGNGGGSLIEARELTGLFVGKKPVVQVRDPIDRRDVLYNETPPAWKGPLAVLVDRASASASEIFAGAIQDYGRGIVLGGKTFGKGTVQTIVPVDDGQLKLTQAKFYRISGSSTQQHGVDPDISLPTLYDEEDVGESSLDEALPWDHIDRVKFTRNEDVQKRTPQLTDRFEERAAKDPMFQWMVDRIDYSKETQRNSRISLNEETRRERLKTDEAARLVIENRRREALGEEPAENFEDVGHTGAFQADVDQIFHKAAVEVLVDWIRLQHA